MNVFPSLEMEGAMLAARPSRLYPSRGAIPYRWLSDGRCYRCFRRPFLCPPFERRLPPRRSRVSSISPANMVASFPPPLPNSQTEEPGTGFNYFPVIFVHACAFCLFYRAASRPHSLGESQTLRSPGVQEHCWQHRAIDGELSVSVPCECVVLHPQKSKACPEKQKGPARDY